MNSVQLLGRITHEPELRATSNGTKVTSFNLAVNGIKNEKGEKRTDFIPITVWNKQAENVCKFVKKGSQIAIQGRISTRSYDAQDGTKRYVTEVVASNVTFLGSKADNASNFESGSSIEDAPTADFSEESYQDFDGDVTLSDDDDLPF